MAVQDDSATRTATHGMVLTDAAAAKAKALLQQEGRDLKCATIDFVDTI